MDGFILSSLISDSLFGIADFFLIPTLINRPTMISATPMAIKVMIAGQLVYLY
jgi:hypothetical protein